MLLKDQLVPTRERILREYDYDREAGTLTRKRDGFVSKSRVNGYPCTIIGSGQIQTAHLIWIIEHGRPHSGRLKRLNGKLDCRIQSLRETGARNPLGKWNNERDNAALERLAAWRERTGVSFEGISDVMTLRLLDPGEE